MRRLVMPLSSAPDPSHRSSMQHLVDRVRVCVAARRWIEVHVSANAS